MGPAIIKEKERRNTIHREFCRLAVYCKFEGEDEADNTDPRAFSNQKAWKRLLVLLAGGVFNIILGFVLFLVIVPSTSPARTNVIDTVVPHSYIEQVGVQPNDKIIKINGKKINFYNDISLYTQNFKKDEQATVTVLRNGEKIDYSLCRRSKLSKQLTEKTACKCDVQ